MKQLTIKTWLFDPELKKLGETYPEKYHDEQVNAALKKVGNNLESVNVMAVGHCIVTVILSK